jgi:AraC-like DNA-binding protein
VNKEGPGKKSAEHSATGRTPCPSPISILETHDPDELLLYLNQNAHQRVEKITPLGREAELTYSRAAIDLGRVCFTRAKSTAVHLEVTTTLLTISISERGHSLIKHRDTEVQSVRGDAAIGSGFAEVVFETSPADARFLVQVDPSEILSQLPAEDGSARKQFGPFRLDLSNPLGANFHRAVNFIWQLGVPPNQLIRAAYDEILLQGLVSISAPVLGGDPPAKQLDPGPAHVQRACELIRSRVSEPVRVADIARELGITPRYLQSGFRTYLGLTPHQFLRDCRLDQAHRMLSAAPPGLTATTIAYDCGFAHLGEFAQSYRSRFGEHPSETLRRAKGI